MIRLQNHRRGIVIYFFSKKAEQAHVVVAPDALNALVGLSGENMDQEWEVVALVVIF